MKNEKAYPNEIIANPGVRNPSIYMIGAVTKHNPAMIKHTSTVTSVGSKRNNVKRIAQRNSLYLRQCFQIKLKWFHKFTVLAYMIFLLSSYDLLMDPVLHFLLARATCLSEGVRP